MISELTIEITDYCPHGCPYCSSRSTHDYSRARFLDYDIIRQQLKGKNYGHLIISGGEPLSHPQFYQILELAKQHSSDVVVYTNAITHLIYNPSVIDGVYLEANLTILPEVDSVHILKWVKQGREADRPQVHLSQNFGRCDGQCGHHVLRPDGRLYETPCDKWHRIGEKIVQEG